MVRVRSGRTFSEPLRERLAEESPYAFARVEASRPRWVVPTQHYNQQGVVFPPWLQRSRVGCRRGGAFSLEIERKKDKQGGTTGAEAETLVPSITGWDESFLLSLSSFNIHPVSRFYDDYQRFDC